MAPGGSREKWSGWTNNPTHRQPEMRVSGEGPRRTSGFGVSLHPYGEGWERGRGGWGRGMEEWGGAGEDVGGAGQDGGGAR